jgi:hypothetical protein
MQTGNHSKIIKYLRFEITLFTHVIYIPLLKDYHLMRERRFTGSNDLESYAARSVSSW